MSAIGAPAISVPCQHAGCRAAVSVYVSAGGEALGYHVFCHHHQSWTRIVEATRAQMAEAGPGRAGPTSPPATGSGGPPAEASGALDALAKAILAETGYAPAARTLSRDDAALGRILETVREALA